MKLDSKKALELLEEGKMLNKGRWVEHSKKVGQVAARIAKQLKLDEEKARTLGYIHDIGKRFGKECQHTIKGYEFLIQQGYDEEYANVCLTHSYLNNDINCTAGGYPNPDGYGYQTRVDFLKSYKYTIYDQIINLCDLMCTDQILTIEKRLFDIFLRRGVFDNTVYHINEMYQLKRKIEKQMNCSIYSLCPEIIDDLNKIELDKTFGVNNEKRIRKNNRAFIKMVSRK